MEGLDGRYDGEHYPSAQQPYRRARVPPTSAAKQKSEGTTKEATLPLVFDWADKPEFELEVVAEAELLVLGGPVLVGADEGGAEEEDEGVMRPLNGSSSSSPSW